VPDQDSGTRKLNYTVEAERHQCQASSHYRNRDGDHSPCRISRQETECRLRRVGRSFLNHAHVDSGHAVRNEEAIAVLLLAGAARAEAGAQTSPPANPALDKPAAGARQLTGKERLGEKWKDEQRIDNCKVSFDKRGTKPRPDGCAHVPPE
jgi:hypothetical protein